VGCREGGLHDCVKDRGSKYKDKRVSVGWGKRECCKTKENKRKPALFFKTTIGTPSYRLEDESFLHGFFKPNKN
jgi:hypothetical protein